MLNRKNFPGLDMFVWWTGIVESRKDPLKIGRAQIRAYAWHTENKLLIPTEELFWAQPIFPTNSSNTTYVCKEGDTVLGFFMDGDSAQFPFFFGRIPDIPIKKYPETVGFSDPGEVETMKTRPVEIASRTMIDGEGVVFTNKPPVRYPDPLNEPTTSRLARNENLDKTPVPFIRSELKTVENVENETWDEIDLDYNAEYPYNQSTQSESGNYVDIDDTKTHERICSIHRTGTVTEMTNAGHFHEKIMKHHYRVVHGKSFINYRGRLKSTGEKKSGLRNKGKVVVEINNDLEMHVAGDVTIHNQTGEMRIVSDGMLRLDGALGVEINSLSGVVVNSPSMYIGVQEFFAPQPTMAYGSGYHIQERQIPYMGPDGETLAKPKKEKKKDSFEQRMAEWLAKITAPTGGGRGACWDSDVGSLVTHHATGPQDVLTYFWCKGATYVNMDDGCYGTPTRINRPDNFSCPI